MHNNTYDLNRDMTDLTSASKFATLFFVAWFRMFCFLFLETLVRSKILKMGGYVTSCELSIIFLKGTRHKQNSLSGNTLFNYMPTYTRSQKKS